MGIGELVVGCFVGFSFQQRGCNSSRELITFIGLEMKGSRINMTVLICRQGLSEEFNENTCFYLSFRVNGKSAMFPCRYKGFGAWVCGYSTTILNLYL